MTIPVIRPGGARVSLLGLLLAALIHASAGRAQELEPRQYTNLPIGMSFLAAGYSVSEGSVLVDPTIELENAEIEIDGPIVGYARSLALGGLSAKVDAGLGRVCLTGSADYQDQRVTRDVCGLTDARLRLAVNFIGAPALRAPEFANYTQDLVVGASLQLTVPSGDYDPDRLVNIGANRWAAKVEVGGSKTVREWIFELALGGTFYETNTDFFGGRARDQEPVYSLQAHVVRTFGSGIWLAVDATHYRGGRTSTDGLPDATLLSNARVGLTLSIPIRGRHSVKINASSGVSTRTGSDFDVLAALWQYRWGG